MVIHKNNFSAVPNSKNEVILYTSDAQYENIVSAIAQMEELIKNDDVQNDPGPPTMALGQQIFRISIKSTFLL